MRRGLRRLRQMRFGGHARRGAGKPYLGGHDAHGQLLREQQVAVRWMQPTPVAWRFTLNPEIYGLP